MSDPTDREAAVAPAPSVSPVDLRTKLFSRHQFGADGRALFTEDMLLVCQCVDQLALEKMIPALRKAFIAKTDSARSLALEEMVPRFVPTDRIAVAALRVYRFLASSFKEEIVKGDTTKDVISDIVALGLPGKLSPQALKLVEAIRQDLNWYEQETRRQQFESGLFPFLNGIGTTVEIRGVFKKEYEFDQNVEDYRKALEVGDPPTMPVISVALSFDSGLPDRVCFQVSEKNARWLIGHLEAALVKLEALKRNLIDRKAAS